jgi:hypothetical protein
VISGKNDFIREKKNRFNTPMKSFLGLIDRFDWVWQPAEKIDFVRRSFDAL